MISLLRLKTFLPLPLVCGALLTLPTARAQTGVTTWAQTYGVASYTNDGQPVTNPGDYSRGADLPNAIAPMPDGGVVVGGQLELNKYYTNPINAQTGGALVRYDRSGAIVWQTLLRQDNDSGDQIAGSVVSYVRTDTAGNIFVAGVKKSQNGSPEPVFVAKFAADGTLVWQTGAATVDYTYGYDGNGKPYIAPSGITGPYAMELTDDGGVILGGAVGVIEFNALGASKSAPIILKINADGSLGFHRIYENNNQYSAVRGVCPAVGGQGYAVILSPDYGSPAPAVATILLTDANGNPMSERTLNNPGGGGYGIVSQFITRDTEGGYFEMNDVSLNRTEVRKLRADLTTVWAKLLDYYPMYSPQLSPSLLPLAGGGCLIGGKASVSTINGHGSGVPDALLLTLDGTGVITSAHLLGGDANSGVSSPSISYPDTPVTACLTTDGGIAFTVTSTSYITGSPDKTDWWVVKADANGKVIGFPDNMVDFPLSILVTTDSPEDASAVTSTYGPPPSTETPPFVTYPDPAFVLEDLTTETGINLPTVKVQAVPTVSYNHPIFFGGETVLGQGVYYLSFPNGNYLGYYSYLTDPSFVYHYDLGYEYVFDANDTGHGVYLYDFKSGSFFYTSPSFPFPYLYDFTLNSTVYYYPDPNNAGRYNTGGVRYFYRFDTGAIFSK